MAEISQIKLPNGTTYDIKDANARERIEALEAFTTYLGVTTTALTDGATTNPIKINNVDVTAEKGNIVLYGNKEFIFDGTNWNEFGDLSALGDLAYKNTASASYKPAGTVSKPSFTGDSMSSTGSYTPAGTVSKPTFTGDSMMATGTYTPAGSVSLTNTNKTAAVSPASSGTATYTPAGSVSAPTISVATAGSTTKVNSITAVGSLPTFTVSGEVLTLTQGTLPTKGSDVTVKTGDASYSASAPTFSGTGVRLVTGNISVPSSASFTGTEANLSVEGTPTGSVSQPTFTGTAKAVNVSGTPTGSVSQPTFNGTTATITVS